MKTLPCILVLVSVTVLGQACGKRIDNNDSGGGPIDGPPGGITVLADNPNAKISDVLQRLRGRWVKEIPDPNQPDPQMMRLFLTADNTLTGRLLIAGAFDDTGVAAQLKEEADGTFTMTLTDDELRPHDFIAKSRVLTGKYDSDKKELALRSPEGEEMIFELPGGYKLTFSGSLSQCHMIPVNIPGASGTPTPAAPATPATPPGTYPGGYPGGSYPGGGAWGGPGGAPWGTRTSAPAHSHNNPLVPQELIASDVARAAPTPAPGTVPAPATTAAHPATAGSGLPSADLPTAKFGGCGITSYFEDSWSRMSGTGID